MPRVSAVLLVVVTAACSSAAEPTTTTLPPTTTTTEPTTTTTRLEDCSTPPYEVSVLPARVSDSPVDPAFPADDPYAEIPGSSSLAWFAADGSPVVLLVRGTLPLRQWPGESGEVIIDGVRARVGPFDDGSWVAAWYEESGDRCDRYTMIFYPPVEPSEVEATLVSMNRTAG